MADNKTTIEVSIQAAEAAKTIQELKKSLKDLVNQQANVSAGSAEWKKLTKAINDTEGKIGDLTDSFKTLQGSGVDRVKNSFNLLKEGFTSFDGGKIKAAFSGIGAAMKAIPIFLIIEGIRYLIENFEKLKNSGGLIGTVFKFIGTIIEVVVNHIEELLDYLGLVDKELNDLAEAAEENAKRVTEALAEQTAEYDRQIAVAKANGQNTVELEIKKQQAILATNKIIAEQTLELIRQGKELTEAEVKRAKEAINNIKNANTQIAVIRATEDKRIEEENKKKAEQAKARREAELADNMKLMQQIEAANLQAIKDEEQRAAVKAVLDRQRRDVDIQNSKASEEVKQQALIASEKTFQDEMAKIYQTKLDKQKAADEKRLKEIEENNKKINDLDNKNLLAGAELRALQNQQDLDSQLALLETKKQLELENKELTENEKALIEERYRIDKENKTKEFAEREKQANFAATAQALQMAQQSLAATQALSDLYFDQKLKKAKGDEKATLEIQKRQFKVNKALAINNALIGTAQSIVQALSSLPPPASYIFAGISAAMGAIQVAKIASSKFEGGEGGGSAPSMSTPTPSIPSAPTVSTPTNNISGTQFDAQGNTITPQAQQPTITVKAQVVESDMTDTQNTVTKYKAQSTF